jgi:hypothetical protein
VEEFGEMMGGYFDNLTGHLRRTRRGGRAGLSAMRHFAALHGAKSSCCARSRIHAKVNCSTLDPVNIDLKHPDYHRKDADLPVALAHSMAGADVLVELRSLLPRRGTIRHPEDV